MKKTAKSSEEKNKYFVRWKYLFFGIALFVMAGLIVLRESDYTVSKLYFIGWPIYSDYAYPPGIEKISFKSLDGTPLTGWYLRSKSPLAANRSVLLYVHGNAGNMAAQYSQFAFLQDWGYDLFAFDYRGFGLSGGHPSRKGLWEDTQSAFQELTLLAPGRKYGVVGFSMGATYAVLLATHEQRVSEAAFIGCFTTFRDIGSYTLRNWGFPRWTTPFLAWLLVPNGLDPEDACHSQTHPPALFVHGTADGNVPYVMGEEMERNYQGQKELLIMPEYGHGDYFNGPLGTKFHQAIDRLFLEKGLTP